MPPFFQVHKQSIESWLETIEPSPEGSEPPAKRACRRQSPTDFPCEDVAAPNTPPLTDDSMMASDQPMTPVLRGARKRTHGEAGGDTGLDEQGLDKTPRPRRPPSLSPRKRTGNKSKAILKQLQKPIQVQAIPNYPQALKSLPADIIPLYEQISAANELENIIPHEVRDVVVKRLVRDNPRYFRPPNPADKGAAKAGLATLHAIMHRALESQIYERDESAWNNMVHTPLLHLVFASDIKVNTELDAELDGGIEVQDVTQSTKVRVRAEPVMSASIAGDSVPLLQGSFDGPVEPACSVSAESLLVSESQADSNLSLSMMRSRSVKIDYVLAVDIPEDTLLRRTIRKLIQTSLLPHVNQTAYLPLQESPIAVSIETKTDTPAQDPLIQLGIWTAAWYQRMYDLRDHLGPGPKPRLVSVPLVQVVGHQWQVYFAQDMGTSINVFGPVPLGSTASILSIYVLLTSLEAIKGWIEGIFCKGLEAWLTPEVD